MSIPGLIVTIVVAVIVYAVLAALIANIVGIIGAVLVLVAGIPSGGFGVGARLGAGTRGGGVSRR